MQPSYETIDEYDHHRGKTTHGNYARREVSDRQRYGLKKEGNFVHQEYIVRGSFSIYWKTVYKNT